MLLISGLIMKHDVLKRLCSVENLKISLYGFKDYEEYETILDMLVEKYGFICRQEEREYVLPSDFETDDGVGPEILAYCDAEYIVTYHVYTEKRSSNISSEIKINVSTGEYKCLI